MTERSEKKYAEFNRQDSIKYFLKTLKVGKEHRSQGWVTLTPDDIDYMKKQLVKLKSQSLVDPYMFMNEAETTRELEKLVEEDNIHEFEPCEAYSCSVCGGLVRDDFEYLECGVLPDGEDVFECPFCGSWNR